MDFVIGLFAIVGTLVLLYYATRIISKMLIWKKLFIIGFLLMSFNSYSQKIHSVGFSSQAEVNVYVVDFESQADLKVYKVDFESQADGNKGLWYFVDFPSRADKKIYFVDFPSRADLKVFFVGFKSQAGWRNASKKYLMY